jgi:hypothetical protein
MWEDNFQDMCGYQDIPQVNTKKTYIREQASKTERGDLSAAWVLYVDWMINYL